MTPRAPIVPCEHGRCRRKVFQARVWKQRGAPEVVVLDAEPVSWADGARIKLLQSGHLPDGVQLVKKLTNRMIHEAFAVPGLYVPHSERCEVALKRKGAAKKGAGHA